MSTRTALKPRPQPPPGPYLVVGLARSGAAAAGALSRLGERVIGCDSGRPAEAAGLDALGVETWLNVDGTDLLDGIRTVVKSPGVPQTAAAIVAARERGVAVTGELELGWRLIPNRFCAVTGTNGKSTTVELLGHLFKTAGMPVAVAGNVGTPLASLVGTLEPDATVVCEASSYQLEDSERFAPECAVLLNLAPDHLERHRTMEDYLAAKLRIFVNQGNDDAAVYNGAQPELRDRDLGGCGRRIRFCPAPEGAADPDCAVSRREAVIFAGESPLFEVEHLKLLGDHNVANAMAAAAAALAVGIDRDAIAEGLESFHGIPHRLEPVGERGGVGYINDSKATNVGAARAGIKAFDGGVHLLLGGRPKDESFEPLNDALPGRVVGVYLFGEAREQLEPELVGARRAGVEIRGFEAMEGAFAAASAAATAGQVVLLSPACASFDAYEDFEQRGEHFRRLVEGIR